MNHSPDLLGLIEDLCRFDTGVVAEANQSLFSRLRKEIPLRLHRYPSGGTFNGWEIPRLWKVRRATVSRNGKVVFDGRSHTLGVAVYSKSFRGELDLEALRAHVVTNPDLPDAYVYHCMWQYRPWDADWALSIPYSVFKTFDAGQYSVDLATDYEDGAMLVGVFDHKGSSEDTIVFNAHTCHPHMANDDFAGVAVLVHLFRWLIERETYHSYRLVLGPEHLGTVFYLAGLDSDEVKKLVSGVFIDMPATGGPIKIASTFEGEQTIDKAFRNAARHLARSYVCVPWRKGAGNDETVWEAPGYEVPFVEASRCLNLLDPFQGYHTSLDTPGSLHSDDLYEFLEVLKRVVDILERDASVCRKFNGLVCLSNPRYDLYQERPDPAVKKALSDDSEKWGYLLDCMLRYFDGSMTILEMAEKHDLSFGQVYDYIKKFEEKGLVSLRFAPVKRRAVSSMHDGT